MELGHILAAVEHLKPMPRVQVTITHAGEKITVEIDPDLKEAAESAADWSDHAAAIFDSIHMGLSSGHLSGDESCLTSLSEVCARAFRSVADDEGERLQRVAMAIRDISDRAVSNPLKDQSILHEDADAAQAKGGFRQAAHLRALARGETDPREPDGMPKGRKTAPATNEAKP